MDESLRIKVEFTDEDPGEVSALLREAGAQNVKEVEQRGFTGLELLVVGIVASQALVSLIFKLTQLWQCGVIVDARGETVVTKRDCKLPRGSVLTVSADGKETKLDKVSESDLASLAKALLPGKA